jgi:hypothetical protein
MNMDWSLNSLIAHCDELIEKNPKSIHTFKNWKTACRSVISMLAPDQQNDVRKVDVETSVHLYAGKKNPSVKTEQEYRGRLRAAITSFTESMGESKPGTSAKVPTTEEKTPAVLSDKPSKGTRSEVKSQPASNTLSIPIRSDFLAQLILPYDITPAEARRLCKFIEALPIEQEKETAQ